MERVIQSFLLHGWMKFVFCHWELGCIKQVISYADVLPADSCVIGLCPTDRGSNKFYVSWLSSKKKKVQCAYNCVLCVIKCISVRKELPFKAYTFPLCTMLQVWWSEEFSADELLDLYISSLVSPYMIHMFRGLWIVGMLMFYKPALCVGIGWVGTVMGGVFLEAVPVLCRGVVTTVHRGDCGSQKYIPLSPTNGTPT